MLLARSLRPRLRPPLASAAAPFSSVSAAAAEAERAVRDGPRNDWTRPEIQAIYDSPLLDLLFHGVRTHARLLELPSLVPCSELVLTEVSEWFRALSSRFGARIAPFASFGLWRVDGESNWATFLIYFGLDICLSSDRVADFCLSSFLSNNLETMPCPANTTWT
jgi:hypothetical protein